MDAITTLLPLLLDASPLVLSLIVCLAIVGLAVVAIAAVERAYRKRD